MVRAMTRVHEALENAVGLVSPRRAAFMTHFRRMRCDEDYRHAVFAMLHARGYKAAQSGRNDGKWMGGSGSGDAELSTSLPAMRNRCRELDRDDSLAGSIFNTMEQNVVTTELRPQARTGDREINKRLESVWNERKDTLFAAEGICMGAAQRRLLRRRQCDGDVFVKPAKRKPDEPVWFELIEGDRVNTPADKSTGRIVDGIEKDGDGVPVAVHVAKGSAGGLTAFVSALNSSDFVRVSWGRIWQSKCGARGGQSRGEPKLHAVIQDLRDLDLLLLAVLKRTQIAACLAVFIKSDVDIEDMLQVTAKQYGYRLDETIEPGMMWKLYPKEEIQTLTPNFPLPDLVPFIIALASRIGGAIGLTWEYVLRDFSKDTYSSARTGQLACEPTWNSEKHDLCADLLTPMWTEVMHDAALRQDARLEGIDPALYGFVQWQGDGRKWVDPGKEAKAKETARKLGIETHYDQCAQLGYDAEEQIDREMQLFQYCLDSGMPEDVARFRAFGIDPNPAPAAPDPADADENDGAGPARASTLSLLYGRQGA